jgi:hypothetical protein
MLASFISLNAFILTKMNYTRPATSGSLLYPIEQVTLSISNIRLQKLNTSPWTLLPQGFNYIVVNAYLDYDNINCDVAHNLFIGYESLLGATISSRFCDFDTTLILSQIGNIGIGTLPRNYWIANSTNSEPLIIWQPIDDTLATYNKFELTITYIKFP